MPFSFTLDSCSNKQQLFFYFIGTLRWCSFGINCYSVWLVGFFLFFWGKTYSVGLGIQLFQLASNQIEMVEKSFV